MKKRPPKNTKQGWRVGARSRAGSGISVRARTKGYSRNRNG